MIEAGDFVQAALQQGFCFYSTVPCSYFKSLLNYVSQDDRLTHVGAANEGDAVAIAIGASLAGQRSIVMIQNSGLGNAVNPLTSLSATFNLPVLLIVTWRAEPGTHDEPQHNLMGSITTDLLDSMEISWEHFPSHKNEISHVLGRAFECMETKRRSFALVMRKDSVLPFDVAPSIRRKNSVACLDNRQGDDNQIRIPDRTFMLKKVVDFTPPQETLVIATTGYTGRELYGIEDRSNQFYMVGSMGCALPLGLGLALRVPRKRVVVLDGDGGLLMRMGAMATVGAYTPTNLVHIVFDNEVHLSTGAQPTVSTSVDFCGIASSSGYSRVFSGNSVEILREVLMSQLFSGPTFLRVKVNAKAVKKLPRPSVTPPQVAIRLQDHIRNGA